MSFSSCFFLFYIHPIFLSFSSHFFDSFEIYCSFFQIGSDFSFVRCDSKNNVKHSSSWNKFFLLHSCVVLCLRQQWAIGSLIIQWACVTIVVHRCFQGKFLIMSTNYACVCVLCVGVQLFFFCFCCYSYPQLHNCSWAMDQQLSKYLKI